MGRPVGIRRRAFELLQEVSHYERADLPRGPENRFGERDLGGPHGGSLRSVGLRYDEVLDRLRAEFPGCRTTVECLRWYVAHINNPDHPFSDGVRLPYRRPRAAPGTWRRAA